MLCQCSATQQKPVTRSIPLVHLQRSSSTSVTNVYVFVSQPSTMH